MLFAIWFIQKFIIKMVKNLQRNQLKSIYKFCSAGVFPQKHFDGHNPFIVGLPHGIFGHIKALSGMGVVEQS